MKDQLQKSVVFLSVFAVAMSLTSCQAIGDIFKAGVWTGIIVVVVIIGLIIYLITRARK